MEPDRLDRAEDEFIDEYLAEHPDASEFEAALMFWTAPDEITMHRAEYDEHFVRQEDRML